MTRLNWSANGQRFYETGVDRGVLFISNSGYAWPGLVSVAENPTGGDAKPYYIDGFKYANVAAAEEFEAQIDAFSAPKEFGPCDGTGSIHNGLFVTQQPRKAFGFSYRTKVGNDVDGADHAYKVHLVYNALAAPADRTHTSLSDKADPETLSWKLTTLPPRVTYGFRPTAHFVVDSRTTPSDILAQFENTIYGRDTNNSSLPTVAELMALFGVEVLDAQFPQSFTDVILDGGTPS